ncbi:SMP-30/gluconolactonase/LRE family protein [Microlunatus antarcticus]|uniref:Sugar lactone lactonase YvrE n=1 Tax=Microlunatus antarcticus TaxID=53388 RepID=A0A7W5JWH6_9ACTN|nr:gluconolaconase [Microlunatus antarcticus]MBB3327062.1 sugar lactone lactonase YvrE [Microlunatus antarcticus]
MKCAALVAAALSAGCLLIVPTTAAEAHQRPTTYVLQGDPSDPQGSKFEGIGVDRRERTFYVSETTGGEIHRGDVRTGRTEVWLREGADGRSTARGVTVDRQGRVYVAGGPNSTQSGGPDLWVYAPDGRLLAALRVDVSNPFLNDVTIGPDGAAYFTNSNAPQIFRVAFQDGRWQVRTWADATDVIPTQSGFNLGGIVVSPDRRALVVAQGNTGQLWRFSLRSGRTRPIDIADANLLNADGLVLRGHTLRVVRNFDRKLSTLRLDDSGRAARLVAERDTDPTRVFTTAKIARGQLLLVDSKFDEPVAAPPYEVVALRLHR